MGQRPDEHDPFDGDISFLCVFRARVMKLPSFEDAFILQKPFERTSTRIKNSTIR